MKKILLSLLLCCLSLAAVQAQKKDSAKTPKTAKADTLAPYKKSPTLPAFNILLTDSTTLFNTYNIPDGRVTVLVLFDPDCSHCKAITEMLTKGMDSLKNIDFYFVTPVHSMTAIKGFSELHHLDQYPNVKAVGRDTEFFYGTFYGVKYVPDLAVYDKHKKLLHLFEGTVTVKELYKISRGK